MKSVIAHMQLWILEMDFLMSQSCFHWCATQKLKINRLKAKCKQPATVFLTQQWGELATHFVFSYTRQFTDTREELQSSCNMTSALGQVLFPRYPMSSVSFCKGKRTPWRKLTDRQGLGFCFPTFPPAPR